MFAPHTNVQNSPCTGQDLSHDLKLMFDFLRAGVFRLKRQDGLTDGTGLNMNYSIIFTEISFYPETPNLLQIIRIIHMTYQIKPELDR